MDIGTLLDRSAIAPRVSAANKRQVLSVIAEIAARSYGLKASTILNGLLRREAQGSTGIGHGVATPHARLRGLDRMHGVFIRLDTPVAFDALDDRPVDLLFALLTPADSTTDHLQALAKVSRVLRPADLRAQLRHASTLDAMQALLTHGSQSNAAA
jgi:PTS system nitrogen regulatory IIA component